MCDEAGPFVFRYAAWCQASGGVYQGVFASQPCVGDTPNTEANLFPRARRFSEILRNTSCPGTDTGWGDRFTSNLCWNGSTRRVGGVVVSESRTMRFASCGETIRAERTRDLTCPAGKESRVVAGATVCVGRQDATCKLGNPISAGSGRKTQVEIDGRFESLQLERHYASSGSAFPYASTWDRTPIDNLWRDGFDLSAHPIAGSTSTSTAVSFPDGTLQYFRASGGPVLALGDLSSRLAEVDAGRFLRHGGRGWVFDAEGRLVAITSPAGERFTLRYADGTTGPAGQAARGPTGAELGGPVPAGYLIEVQSSFGRSLRFDRDVAGRLTRTFRPGSAVAIRFEYGDDQRLQQVTYEDGSGRLYAYGEAALTGPAPQPNLLTGIFETVPGGSASRFATFRYDGAGRGVSTEHAGGADRVSLVYAQNGLQTQAQDALGATRTMQFVEVRGALRLAGQSQPAGSGCAASTQSQTYDANGNIASTDDFAGNRVCRSHDLGRNLETVRVEGLAGGTACTSVAAGAALPAGSRKTSTQWHPDWSLQTRVAEPGRVTTYVYNGQPDPYAGGAAASCAPADARLPDGKPIAVLCRQLEQATTDGDGAAGFAAVAQAGVPVREQRWTYNAHGQVLTHDGPRSDVNDLTVYEYHSDTAFTGSDPAAVGHTRGDLLRVTNAAGHVTQYTLYNKAGQLLQSIDPNGVVSTFGYDLRGRLTSHSVGAQTTTYAWWPTGLIQRVTAPDGSWTFYEHDAAHRLWRVSDNLGNRITYTLDNAGNRTAEAVSDPSGVLRRHLARGIDALGRVEQLTGRE